MANIINKIVRYLDQLITNNTGRSSKNFYLVGTTILASMLLLVPFIAILVEVFATHTVQSDLTGWGAYIGSAAGLLASAGITKAWSEKNERKQ